MFHHRVRSTPDTEAIHFRKEGAWHVINWKEVGARSRNIACGLRAAALGAEQRVAILAATRMEWILVDMGILCAGGATTTIYPSNTPEECSYILIDSGCRFVFAENQKQVDKLSSVRHELPNIERVYIIDGKASADGWVMSLAELEKIGHAWDAANPGAYDAVADAVGPDHLATLIYTSGTTGKPKGVMLTHDNWVYEGEAIDNLGIITPADKQFLFLPLAHSFAKVLELAFIRIGVPTAVDGDIDSLVDNLGVVKPTFMGAVPRIFEKVYNKVVSGAREGGGVKLKIFTWAMSVGKEVSALRQKKQEPSGWLSVKLSLADKLVFSKLKARFGGRIRFFISGGAPLSREIAEFFHAADLLVLEGYGLTESSAGTFMNRLDEYKFGTVGPPVPSTQVKFAEDGEILIKGRGVMRGYYNLPADTAEALDADGWLHTGDIGELRDGNFLAITDRKKDLIKTSGGKYVAPQSIENKLKARSPLISQVLVHGDNRNYCTVLIAVSEDTTKSWLAQQGITVSSYAELAAHPKVNEEIARVIDECNREFASYESLKKFAILPKDLSLEDGDLTPKLSVKRKVVEKKYKDVLDRFYEGTVASLSG
ncbi:MAG: long-chain fatty acid--CoA ligase [Pseudomonadota bacterium]|nr:long-chain fatty acid--CoA ligase [Pseudomonadota bacterium]